MGIDDNVPSLLSGGRVNEPKPPGSLYPFPQLLRASIPDDHALAAGVIANVVGVVRELGPLQALFARGQIPIPNIQDPIVLGISQESILLLFGGISIVKLRPIEIIMDRFRC